MCIVYIPICEFHSCLLTSVCFQLSSRNVFGRVFVFVFCTRITFAAYVLIKNNIKTVCEIVCVNKLIIVHNCSQEGQRERRAYHQKSFTNRSNVRNNEKKEKYLFNIK